MPTAGKAGNALKEENMENEKTVNQGNASNGQGDPAGDPAGVPKTFTQEELDRIVGERLTRERAKYPDYEEMKAKAARLDELEEANKTELEKANEMAERYKKELDALKNAESIRTIREKVAKEMEIPVNLLTSDTEEGCKEQAAAIKAFAKPGYPKVKDGGEPQNTHGQTTREQFADWVNNMM